MTYCGDPQPVEREQIGYQLVPLYAPLKGQLVTQAFILCRKCNAAVYSVSGPRTNALCMECGEKVLNEIQR